MIGEDPKAHWQEGPGGVRAPGMIGVGRLEHVVRASKRRDDAHEQEGARVHGLRTRRHAGARSERGLTASAPAERDPDQTEGA